MAQGGGDTRSLERFFSFEEEASEGLPHQQQQHVRSSVLLKVELTLSYLALCVTAGVLLKDMWALKYGNPLWMLIDCSGVAVQYASLELTEAARWADRILTADQVRRRARTLGAFHALRNALVVLHFALHRRRPVAAAASLWTMAHAVKLAQAAKFRYVQRRKTVCDAALVLAFLAKPIPLLNRGAAVLIALLADRYTADAF